MVHKKDKIKWGKVLLAVEGAGLIATPYIMMLSPDPTLKASGYLTSPALSIGGALMISEALRKEKNKIKKVKK
jgi:hypothetical protein